MISIIIPAHNEIENLKKLVPYLATLIVDIDAEVIISVSSSNSDKTELEHPNAKIIFLKCKNSGRAVQMNSAVEIASGDVVVFLHADVKPPISFLTDIENAIKNKFDAGFFSYRFDKESFLLRINASFTTRESVFTGGGDQCLFIKKGTFIRLGKFNEEQVIMEDFEFFSRMKKNKLNYTIIKKDLIVSARKYESNSYLRVNFTNLLLVFLFNLGYPSSKLKTIHNKMLKLPYNN